MQVDSKPQEFTPGLDMTRMFPNVPLPSRVEIPGVSDVELRDSTKMLLALGRTKRHFYEGTVPSHVKARRRRRNRAARHARRVHRR